jgi:hypothetical protein
MAYSLYAYRQVYVPSVTGGAINLNTTGTTDVLTPGQLGLFTYNQGIIGTAISAATANDVIFGVGSYHTVDAISPTMGGLLESDKSKPVNWRNVTRFWKKAAVSPANMVISVGWDQTLTGSTSLVGPTFNCGTMYRLLLEAKGSPALRTLGHEMFKDGEAWTGCCTTTCQSGCTGQLVDAATVMLQWSDFIKKDPIMSLFIAPKVYINGTLSGGAGSGVYTYNTGAKAQVFSAYDISLGLGASSGVYVPNTTASAGSVVTALQITAAYVDTKFGNCTFTPSDHYELEPLLLYASLRMDDGLDSNPCQVTTTINTSVPNMVVTLQNPVQASGIGETVVREWIDYRRYKTEYFADGYHIDLFRIRTIEDDVCLANINRNAFYDEIHLLYNQAFYYNSTSTVDHPQYEAVFYVPTGTSSSTFTTLITNCLSNVNSNVTLETF